MEDQRIIAEARKRLDERECINGYIDVAVGPEYIVTFRKIIDGNPHGIYVSWEFVNIKILN